MERGYLISNYFSDGEVWALITALNVMAEETALTDEQYGLVESAKNKILEAIEKRRNNMKCSEITLREAINMIEIFYPVKVVYDDIILYNEYDSGEQFSPLLVIPMRMKGLEDRIVTDINIEFVDFHHSIITLKGE